MEPSDSNVGIGIGNPAAGSISRPESAQSFESSQHFCLRWNNYQTNLTNVFDQLLQNESFVDVTLTTDETGQSVKCHKVVLSACSPYFQKLFMDNPCQHPIVILRDVDFEDLKFVVDYMYKGEINVTQNQLTSILRTAEMLKVRGLDEMVKTKDNSEPELEIERSLEQPKDLRPHKKRKFSLESIECFPKRIGIKTRDDLFDHEQQKIRQNMAANSNNLPHPDDMESPRATPDHFRQPTGSATGYETQRSQSGHSDGGFESKPATIGKPPNKHSPALLDDMTDVKPGIMEMIQEERRAKLLEASQITQNWMQAAAAAAAAAAVNSPQATTSGPPRTPPSLGGGNPGGSPVGGQGAGACNASNPNMSSKGKSADPNYQFQLQNIWQKCWSQNAAMMQGVRYRERGPMKSWRPETMAEAIWAVLQEGLSLSQAARKHDIPYPTFVLYANRVHNMLGPSITNGNHTVGAGNMNLDLRPKGRGRPQRILLGNWPDEHVRQVIRAVVFRDGTIPSYNHAAAANFSNPQSAVPRPGTSTSPRSSFGSSPAPRAPPPTPALGRPVTPQQSHHLQQQQQQNMSKFLDNNFFATHLKTLSEHFSKNGGSGNGFLESLPFKAFMNDEIHQAAIRKSMEFEDADESCSGGGESRRGSLTPPSSMSREMPKLIPTAAIRGGPHPSGSTNNNGGHADESEHDFLSHGSHSNETSLPLNEDPMNLVETSWDISTTLQPQHNGGKQLNSTSNETTNVCGNNGPSPQPQQQQQSSIHIKN